jgi:hypothetical protein
MQGNIKKLKLNQETLRNLTNEQKSGLHIGEALLSGGTWCQLCSQQAA